jgi:hypothetical protein
LEYPYKTASKMLIFCQILTIQSFRWSWEKDLPGNRISIDIVKFYSRKILKSG